ncbi:hypothetical protein CTAYLR_005813 [Chrysophaeum taylorii]|uniref:Uncharacterized protein n=1 Tax=Chrysophaeum taylorii TaxID=2483200 RepID=A0AAD7ULQ0_9STRA|nr:hypothetical protein CTAYLR_005813 [Chrysophaeum taylorii]
MHRAAHAVAVEAARVGTEAALAVLDDVPLGCVVHGLIAHVNDCLASCGENDGFAKIVAERCKRLEAEVDELSQTDLRPSALASLVDALLRLGETAHKWSAKKKQWQRLWAAKKYRARFADQLQHLDAAAADLAHLGVTLTSEDDGEVSERLDEVLADVHSTNIVQQIEDKIEEAFRDGVTANVGEIVALVESILDPRTDRIEVALYVILSELHTSSAEVNARLSSALSELDEMPSSDMVTRLARMVAAVAPPPRDPAETLAAGRRELARSSCLLRNLWDGPKSALVALPIEFAMRLLLCVVTSSYGLDATPEELFNDLAKDARKILDDGIVALRTADLQDAWEELRLTIEVYETLILEDLGASLGNKKISDVDRASCVRNNARKVQQLADAAFYRVPSLAQKVVAVKIAMTAAVFEIPVGSTARYVHYLLKSQVRKLLENHEIASLAARYYRGSTWMKDSHEFQQQQQQNDALVADVMLVVACEHQFAVAHGFRDLLQDDALIPAHDLVGSTASWSSLFQSHDEIGLLIVKALPSELIARFQASRRYTNLIQAAGIYYRLSRVLPMGKEALRVLFEPIEELHLGYRNIGNGDVAAAVAEVLKHNSTLQTLNLRHVFLTEERRLSEKSRRRANSIDNAGATAIAGALKQISTLQTIVLSWNFIGASGATAIADVLTQNMLETLNMRGNCIREAGATAIAKALIEHKSSLKTLDLDWNSIGDAGAAAIAELLKENSSSTLQTLELRYNGIGADGAAAVAAGLEQNLALQRLDLGRNSVGDAGAASLATALAKKSRLRCLGLGENSIGNPGAAAIAETLKMNELRLQTLDLGWNSIGDAGFAAVAEALKQNSSLRSLDLRSNSIGDHGDDDDGIEKLAEALKENSTLQSLDLRSNTISDAGAVAIGESLHLNSTLDELNLWGNCIENAGGAAIAEALVHNSGLQRLDLGRNLIGDVGGAAIAEAVKRNSSLQMLNLCWNSIGADGAAAIGEALEHNKNSTTELNLRWNSIGGGLCLPRNGDDHGS